MRGHKHFRVAISFIPCLEFSHTFISKKGVFYINRNDMMVMSLKQY